MRSIVLLRHAIAQDQADAVTNGIRDEDRSLTTRGREKMRRGADGLRALVPRLDLILTSPLHRASQTADILLEMYRQEILIEECENLSPGSDFRLVVDTLRRHRSAKITVCVGHEPDLSKFASWLLTQNTNSLLVLKKGGACLIEFPKRFEAGHGRLAWLLTPRALRRLATRNDS